MPRTAKTATRGEYGKRPAASPIKSAAAPHRPRDGGARLSGDLSSQLEGMSVSQLNAVISRAESLREEKTHGERQAFIDDIRSRAAELGVSVEDLFGRRGGGRPPGRPSKQSAAKPATTGQRRSPPAKYKSPNGELWSGRGRSPRWLSALMNEGHSKDEYLIR